MSNENQPQFERDLAGAAKPEEFEGGKDEPIKDPAKSLRAGLIRLYEKYVTDINRQLQAGSIKKEDANTLTAQVNGLSLADLGYEISKGMPVEIAKEIMGPNMCFGPEEVRKAGIEIREEIPPVPFNTEELEHAKELGQMLIYRTSTTMKELNDTISPQLEIKGKGKLLSYTHWCRVEGFYESEKIQPGWALVSKDLTPGSTDKTYLGQSEFLAEYLQNEVFKGKPLPPRYQEAIDKLNAQKENIRLLVAGSDEDKLERAAEILANLKINQLFRQSSAEVVYDFIVYFQNTGERLHEIDYVWTSTRHTAGVLVHVGSIDDMGASVDGDWPDHAYTNLGISFSRRGSDLKS